MWRRSESETRQAAAHVAAGPKLSFTTSLRAAARPAEPGIRCGCDIKAPSNSRFADKAAACCPQTGISDRVSAVTSVVPSASQ